MYKHINQRTQAQKIKLDVAKNKRQNFKSKLGV